MIKNKETINTLITLKNIQIITMTYHFRRPVSLVTYIDINELLAR